MEIWPKRSDDEQRKGSFSLSPGTAETFRTGLAGCNPGSNYSGDFNLQGERARLIGSTGKMKYIALTNMSNIDSPEIRNFSVYNNVSRNSPPLATTLFFRY